MGLRLMNCSGISREHPSVPVLRTQVSSFALRGQISRRAEIPFSPERTVHRIRQLRFCLRSLNRITLSPRDCISGRWTAIFGFGAMYVISHTVFRGMRCLRLRCAGHERQIPVCRSASSRFHAWPDFIIEALPGLFLFLLPCGVPRPQAQEAQHVHFIDFLHPPAVLHQFVAGGIDVFRQGQASCGIPR